MSILNKDSIRKYILPLLPVAKRGKRLSENEQISLIEAILYRLKTGCQWRELPLTSFFDHKLSWKTVFYHFNNWSKSGVWEKIWIQLLATNKRALDMSSVQLDGSQSRCYKARQAVGYQGRKADNTTNMLFLSDNEGLILALSEPVSGEHHDLFEIEKHLEELLDLLQKAGISHQGLFLNADAGFDSLKLREVCKKKIL